jgi:subtilase family serine protease
MPLQGDATFALGIKQGTSMAAPLVAGIAALVRQYFMEGWCASYTYVWII